MPSGKVSASGLPRTGRLRGLIRKLSQFFVDAVDTLMIPLKAFDVAQKQVAQAKAPVAVVVCELEQLVTHSKTFHMIKLNAILFFS